MDPKTTHIHISEEAEIKKGYRSLFLRLLAVFLLLATLPLMLYALFGSIVYLGQVRKFLPPEESLVVDHALITQIVLTVLLVLIMVVFAASLTSGSLIRPLKRLLRLTHLVGEGKLQYRLKPSLYDEIGELTQAFNIMVARLNVQKGREHMIEQLKSEFISVAAHQLRTPLSAIKWTFRMLIDGDIGTISDEQKEFLSRGYQTNEHMIGLVNDLLDASRIEQGHFGYDFAAVDFVDYARKFVASYEHQALSRKITAVFVDPVGTIPTLYVDKSKMDLVFQNLLDNSIKYSRPGGEVHVSMKTVPAGVEVCVEDHGVGIPARQMERVFSKFFRGDNVVRMETEGSGLGLFIVKNIIKNHGGDIRVESEENKGTKMIFTLPTSKDAIPKKEAVFEEFMENI